MKEQIIRIMEQHRGSFVSGEELSRRLDVSRTAVWKHIAALREDGYEFEAVPKRGYRLVQVPERLRPERIRELLRTTTLGHTLHVYDTLDSTQTKAHELVAQGAQEGTLVIADRQTAGRGRMGRVWHSPPGAGIYMSLILKPRIPLQFTPQLTLLAAVALCRAIVRIARVPVGIKWPNDLLIGGKKICGILLESSAEDERLRYIVAGMGIGVNLLPDDYPPELRSIATSLAIEAGHRFEREVLIAAVLEEFEALYKLYDEQGFGPIRSLWEANSASLNRPVRVRTAQGELEGIAESLDDSGGLNVRLADGTMTKIFSGEVELR
ncbi:biotin [Gordoniibacillus kamchatkensis]|uniref:Bifunctional ligase/repressor BirA n=1 Tax=Gordoniibacillus kamchatkensis TaxID=1590651 RepID=A0ABR5AGK9_9BACL|nr:biotin--[acetyl-CoA-carboxylase] ligase [Paenibacillus sp. VKM B-2647]KIL40027.1 biotin [Paenibacillus sp. VKM B-2647]